MVFPLSLERFSQKGFVIQPLRSRWLLTTNPDVFLVKTKTELLDKLLAKTFQDDFSSMLATFYQVLRIEATWLKVIVCVFRKFMPYNNLTTE